MPLRLFHCRDHAARWLRRLGLGAGALIGDQLQGQERTQSQQEQQIEQNQAEIQRQRQQIEQLKRRQEY